MTVAIIAFILALKELLDNPVSLVLIACVAAYNYGNAKTHEYANRGQEG
jgi:hypothetical protein